MQFAVVLGHGGRDVGGRLVDCRPQLDDNIPQEAVDDLFLLLAGLLGDLAVHLVQQLAAGAVGLVLDRNGFPEIVTLHLFFHRFDAAAFLGAVGLGRVFGEERRERNVGVFPLPSEAVVNLLAGGDEALDLLGEAFDEPKLIVHLGAGHCLASPSPPA